MRLFTALDLPDPLRDRIASHRAPDRLDARWTVPDQYHVTLRFIGSTDADTAARYEDALADVTAPVAECQPYGLDVLPSRRDPRVLVVGLEHTDTLRAVYAAVSDALGTAGLAPEDRSYRPHVTLARLSDADPRVVHRVLDAQEPGEWPPVHVRQFHLYESTRTPDGAVHERRATYALGTSD